MPQHCHVTQSFARCGSFLALTLFSLVAREMRCDFRVWLTAGNSAKQAGRVINRQEARRMPKMKLREPGFSDCFRFDSNANSNF